MTNKNKEKEVEKIAENENSGLLIEVQRYASKGLRSIRFLNDSPKNAPKDDNEDEEGAGSNGLGEKLLFISKSWEHTCLGFFEAAPHIVGMADFAADAMSGEVAVNYIEKRSTKSEKQEDDDLITTIYTLPEQERLIVRSNMAKANRFLRVTQQSRKSLLIALIAEYESFFRAMLYELVRFNPDAFNMAGSSVAAEDIFNAQSLDDLREIVFEEKLNSMLRDSHISQLKTLAGYFGTNFLSDKKLTREFGEICERRNLIIHGGGVVNRQYTENCRKLGIAEKDIPKLGSHLDVDGKYLRRAISRIFQFGFFSLHILWQKILPDEVENSVTCCINISHDFLESDLTKMARRVCDFALAAKLKNAIPEAKKAYLTINRALSFFLDNEMEEKERQQGVDESLKFRDWSIVDSTMSLALGCLKEDYSRIDEQVLAVSKEGIGYWEFSTWMIFAKARENPDFRNAVKSHIGLQFEETD